MIDKLIEQLHDPDAAVRRQAILALGRTKDPAALRPLATIVRGDPDEQLRELARKAGLYIRQQTQQKSASPKPSDKAPDQGSVHSTPDQVQKLPKSKPGGESPFTVPITGALEANPAFMPPDAPDSPAQDDAENVPPATLRFQQLLEEERRQREAELPDPDELPDLPLSNEDLYTPHYSYGDESSDGSRSDSGIRSLREIGTYGDDSDDDGNENDDAGAEDDSDESREKVEALRGRRYVISKDDEVRAKQYLDAALTLNMDGDNARAMKNLTSALGLDPRLVKDTYFNSVAASVTGLEGDEAVQMIADRGERKRFTEAASQRQKNRRVERHMDEALQSTWVDFWFELIVYSLITIIGSVLAVLVARESGRNVLNGLIQSSGGDLAAEYQALQDSFNAITAISLPLVGVVSGISGVLSLLLQTVLIHYVATKLLHGAGTWRHLIHVLLSFYNKWFPILFFLLYVTIAMFFISLGSPIILCFMLVLLILSLYVSGKTSAKIGEAYDFGGAMGCVSLILSSVVIILINALISFMLAPLISTAMQVPLAGLP